MNAKQSLLSALSLLGALSRAKALALCLLLLAVAAPFGGASGLAAQAPGAAATPGPILERAILERAIAEQRKKAESQNSPRARATALNDLANLLELGGDIAAAFKNYRAAIEADDTWAPAHYNLALLAYTTGDSDLASSHLEAATELEPDNAWAHYQLGRIADDAGEAGKALERYIRAVSLDSRLAFGDVNPHFLVNRYATEILLRADRTPLEALPPRTYSEPRRISGLLLPARAPETAPRREEAAAAEEVPEDDAGKVEPGEAARRVTVDRHSSRRVNRSTVPAVPDGNAFQEPTVRPATAEAPVTASARDERADLASDRRTGREPQVFTRDDLRRRTLGSGGAVGVPAGSPPPSSRPTSGRRGGVQAGTPVGPGGRQPAGGSGPGPASGTFGGSGGGRFEPSFRSSAQLDVTIRRFPAPAP